MEKDNRKSLKWTIILFAIGLGFIALIIYINSSISLITMFISMLGTSILAWGLWFLATRYFIESEPEVVVQEKLPKPVTVAERKQIVEHILKNEYSNYVLSWLGEKTWEKGQGIKSLINAFLVEMYWEGKTVKSARYLVILNCHNPLDRRDVLIVNDGETLDEIWKKAELAAEPLADYPKPNIETREILTRNVMTGNEQLITEPIKEEKKDEKNEEVAEK